ncbi:MAG TPA: O-antigen ligase family protein [Bryobacteraceae bacterium]|nr:O-antigen ligase family protein [Bryobacteraceae bacterium]
MAFDETAQQRILVVVSVAAAAMIHVSIAVSQILLGVGIALTLVFRRRLNFPRIWIPLLALFLWTVLADALCPDPWTGRAQIKKFFVFLFIPLLYGTFARQFSKAFYVVIGWAVTATASGIWSLVQFVQKYYLAKEQGQNFYVTYTGHRITGFESHWLTFGALQLSVLLLLLAQVFFSSRRMPAWAYASIAILSAAILLTWDRSIWLAAVPAVFYLVWCWKPKWTLALPVLIVAAFALAPAGTRDRMISIVNPHGETDSNRHRIVTFLTGVEMVKAHPWFGLGPEEIARNFDKYVPPSVRRPLPVGYYGHLHDVYLQYAAERGIPGLLLLLAFIGLTVWDCAKALRRAGPAKSPQRFLLHGTIAVVVAIMVGGTLEYNLGDSEVLMMFVCVVALGYVAIENVNVETACHQAASPVLSE